MIYVGYQGVGKSSIAGKNGCIDLESGNFWIDGERPNDWYKIYVNIAEHLSRQGYNVFISSHKIVRCELANRGIEYCTIAPAPELKGKWLNRLHERYVKTGLEKDYKALMNAKECYVENVLSLIYDDDSVMSILILSTDYDLYEETFNLAKEYDHKSIRIL